MNYEELKQAIREIPDSMTSSERSRAYMSGDLVDHIPVSIGSEEAMADVYGYSSEQFRTDLDVTADVLMKRSRDFDITGIRVGLALNTVGEALGSEIFYPERGTGRVSRHVLNDLSGIDELMKIDPYKSPVYLGLLDRCRRLKDRLPDYPVSTMLGGPLSAVVNIRPLPLVLRDSVKNPDALKSLLKLSLDHSLAWLYMMDREFGHIGCGIGDPVSCTTIISRNQYLEYSLPYQKELIDGIISITDKKPKLHICGKTEPLWNDIKTLDISCFSVDNVEDMGRARDILGESFCISGNVAPVDTMLMGSIDDVIEESRKCIEKAADSPGGFILGTGCQLPVGTPVENIEAFIYAARKYGRNARMGEIPEGIRR